MVAGEARTGLQGACTPSGLSGTERPASGETPVQTRVVGHPTHEGGFCWDHTPGVPLVKLKGPQATEFPHLQKLEALLCRKAVVLYPLEAYPLGQSTGRGCLEWALLSHARAVAHPWDTHRTDNSGGRGGRQEALAQGGPMGEGRELGLSLHCYT